MNAAASVADKTVAPAIQDPAAPADRSLARPPTLVALIDLRSPQPLAPRALHRVCTVSGHLIGFRVQRVIDRRPAASAVGQQSSAFACPGLVQFDDEGMGGQVDR